MKRREFIRHLSAEGCVLIREGGNHSWWGNPARNLRSAVPRHTEINKFLAERFVVTSELLSRDGQTGTNQSRIADAEVIC